MKLQLTEQLWDTLNPEFDGHFGMGKWSPVWKPHKDLCLIPIKTYKPMDIGNRERKSFVVMLEDVDSIVVHVPEVLEYINGNIYLGKKRNLVFDKKVTLIK